MPDNQPYEPGFSLRDALHIAKDAGPVSVLQTIPSLAIKHIHLNLILVSSEDFTDDQLGEIATGVEIMRDLYAAVDIGVGSAQSYSISRDQALPHLPILNNAEAMALTEEWTFPNTSIDIFVVMFLPGDLQGLSPGLCTALSTVWFGGTCKKDSATGWSGCVVAYQSNDDFDPPGKIFGHALAHEVGHYLGLCHVLDENNLMYPYVPNGGQLTQVQADFMKKHCFMRYGCRPPRLD